MQYSRTFLAVVTNLRPAKEDHCLYQRRTGSARNGGESVRSRNNCHRIAGSESSSQSSTFMREI